MHRITDVLINAISVKKLAGPIVMKMAVSSLERHQARFHWVSSLLDCPTLHRSLGPRSLMLASLA